MWTYEKKLQYPVNIKNPNPRLAQMIMTQLGGPDGELGASMRYLNQRYSCPYAKVTGALTDIGTEELGHMEMISAIVYQLTKSMTMDEIKKSGFDAYFVDQSTGMRLPHPQKKDEHIRKLYNINFEGPPVCCYPGKNSMAVRME